MDCVTAACGEYARQGVCNLLISNGDWLFTLCTSKLAWIARRAPFGPAQLSDVELVVDFQEHTTSDDVVTVIATEPLTSNETWHLYAPGEWRVWQGGEISLQGRLPACEPLIS